MNRTFGAGQAPGVRFARPTHLLCLGTWREAAINLKGVADDALSAGRKIVADTTATWGTR
jgi:hypothetical protein